MRRCCILCPTRDPQELVQLARRDATPGSSRAGAVRSVTRRSRSHSIGAERPRAVAMWRSIFRSPIADGPEPERLRGYEIDEHYLGLF